MRGAETRQAVREAARAYAEALPAGQRKQLGQFFTGLPLGKLLAHLALSARTQTVVDPMAGHGDLLDATWEAAAERGIDLERLDGIEIDDSTAAACRARLAQITGEARFPERCTIAADAFDPASVAALPQRLYDLVITNPPYVRYQTRNTNGGKGDHVRAGLAAIVASSPVHRSGDVWSALIEGYSGLADLSVPAWLQAASLVRPGGRLALVVPATWRSRDYADVIRYLLLRCFKLEYVVEDTQPGWFSDALVRTHLIVAQRLHPEEASASLGERADWSSALWLQVAPEASNGSSLVGATFDGDHPEAQFAAWAHSRCTVPKAGISVRSFSLHDEWASLAARVRQRRWYHKLESTPYDLPLFTGERPSGHSIIPEAFRDLLPIGVLPGALCTLEEAGIQVGQGLRTGCNRFFYVSARGLSDSGMVTVEASALLDRSCFAVPASVVRPVLRRQSETGALEKGSIPDGRVLDLRRWVLPEDTKIVVQAGAAYATCGETPPEIMPDELATYVRMAANVSIDRSGDLKRIPQLSAVRTNMRLPRKGHITPRFWYMLPEFTARHLPAAFVPRINDGVPWVESNCDPPILIDANFSTFWAPNGDWSRHALKALLNSTWCRALMEALGTPFGGGALKLEATHLRHLPVPILSAAAKSDLDEAGRQLTRNAAGVQSRVDEIVLDAVLNRLPGTISVPQFAQAMADRARNLSTARQKAA